MAQPLASSRICFVGAGSIAEAILRGLIGRGMADPQRISVLNRQNAARLDYLAETYRIRTSVDPVEKEKFVREADIVILAMKPKDAGESLRTIRGLLNDAQLIVSVVAGLSTETIRKLLGFPAKIARTMPNTSSTIGEGATGVAFTDNVEPERRELALELFRAVGIVFPVEEQKLDIVTGVSGSGPAYVYYLMEAMIAAGVAGGLPEDVARKLTVQTVLGAARMVETTGEMPEQLRRNVTSPNGTTQAAIETLDRFQFREGVTRAVLRAAERAREIGETIAAESINEGRQV